MEHDSGRMGKPKRKLFDELDVVGWATILGVPLAVAGIMLTVGIAIGSSRSAAIDESDTEERVTETVTATETITERPSDPTSEPGPLGTATDGSSSAPPTVESVLHQKPLDLVSGMNYWDLDRWERTEARISAGTDVNINFSGSRYLINMTESLGAEVASADRAACMNATNYTSTAIELKSEQLICLRTSDQNLALLRVRSLPDCCSQETVGFDVTVWDEP